MYRAIVGYRVMSRYGRIQAIKLFIALNIKAGETAYVEDRDGMLVALFSAGRWSPRVSV